jgi:TolB protein
MKVHRLLVLSTVLALVPGALAAPPAQAAKRGSNGQLAYSVVSPGQWQVVRKNSDGSGVVTPVTDPTGFDFPTWSPDGTMIAARQYNVGIFMFPSTGGHPVLLDADGGDFTPSWSPDGRFIAFQKGGGALVILPVDLSTGPIVVAPSGLGPDWSPDGHSLAYEDAGGTLFTVNVFPSVDVPVPRTPAGTVNPFYKEVSWSPDGTRIAYAKPSGSGLAFVTLGNQAPTDINGTAGAFGPSWSPDGRSIAFYHWPAGGVFTTPVHNGTVTTVDPAGYFPDWEAISYRSFARR